MRGVVRSRRVECIGLCLGGLVRGRGARNYRFARPVWSVVCKVVLLMRLVVLLRINKMISILDIFAHGDIVVFWHILRIWQAYIRLI